MGELEKILRQMTQAGFDAETLRPAFVGSSGPEETLRRLVSQGVEPDRLRPFFVAGEQPDATQQAAPAADPDLSAIQRGRQSREELLGASDPDRAARLRTFLQGIPGVGRGVDEAEAGVRSLLPGRDFGTEVQRIREQLRDFRERRPGAATEAALGGAVAGTAGTLGAAGALGLGSRVAATPIGRVGQAAALGGAEGAVSGVLGGEGAADRFLGGVAEGALGAGLGGTLGGAVEVGRAVGNTRIAQAARRLFGDSDKIDREGAVRSIARRLGLDADDLDNDELAAVRRMAERAENLPEGSETRLVDLADDNARQLFRDAFRTPSPNRTSARAVIEGRQETAGRRAREAIFEDAPIPPGTGVDTDPVAVSQAIAQRQDELAAPLYREAFNAPPIRNKRIRELIQSPRIKRRYNKLREIYAERGRRLPPPDSEDFALPVEAADDLKKILDDEVNSLFDAGRNAEARTLKETRNDIREIVKEEVPVYAEALETFGGLQGQRRAIELGAGDVPGAKAPDLRSPAQMRRELEALDNETERQLYRLSALNRMAERVKQKAANANQQTRFLRSENDEERLRILLGDDVFERVQNRLAPIGEEQQVSNFLRGGSPTSADQLSARDAAVTAIEQVMLGGPRRVAGVLAGDALGEAGLSAGVAGQINRLGVVQPARQSAGEIFDLVNQFQRRRTGLDRLTPVAGLAGGQASTRLFDLLTGRR